jgi:hypothetical protein
MSRAIAGHKPCKSCGKMIGAAGSRNFCVQCTRKRKALNHALRVKQAEPKPAPVEKPRENLDHVWAWLVDNEPVRKCQVSTVMFGEGNRPEQALIRLERNGYLLAECERGLLYAFEVVR